jgi:hypothetical protein
MKAFFARTFVAAAVSVMLVMWLGHPASTCATVDSTPLEFRALTSMT